MKKSLQKFRRFFARTGAAKKFHASTTRDALAASYDEDEGGTKLSGAFIIVLILHVVALAGVFAFARIKDSRATNNPIAANQPKGTTPTGAAPALTAKSDGSALAEPPAVRLSNPPTGRTHVVKSGETLARIAVAYNVSVAEIVKNNTLKSDTDIRSGQVLLLPEGKAGAVVAKTPEKVEKAPEKAPEPKPVVKTPEPVKNAVTTPGTPKNYVVKSGETLAKIAREHGCTYDEIVKLNNIKDPKKIQPGQVLKVPAVKKG